MGIANKEDILFADYRILPYENIKKIDRLVPDNGITPIGRFGEWKYLWSDQAFLSGYHAAQKQITNGEKK